MNCQNFANLSPILSCELASPTFPGLSDSHAQRHTRKGKRKGGENDDEVRPYSSALTSHSPLHLLLKGTSQEFPQQQQVERGGSAPTRMIESSESRGKRGGGGGHARPTPFTLFILYTRVRGVRDGVRRASARFRRTVAGATGTKPDRGNRAVSPKKKKKRERRIPDEGTPRVTVDELRRQRIRSPTYGGRRRNTVGYRVRYKPKEREIFLPPPPPSEGDCEPGRAFARIRGHETTYERIRACRPVSFTTATLLTLN